MTVPEGQQDGALWPSAAQRRAKDLGFDPLDMGEPWKALGRRFTGGICVFGTSVGWKLEGLMLRSEWVRYRTLDLSHHRVFAHAVPPS